MSKPFLSAKAQTKGNCFDRPFGTHRYPDALQTQSNRDRHQVDVYKRQVHGVGELKYQKYGEQFLALCQKLAGESEEF